MSDRAALRQIFGEPGSELNAWLAIKDSEDRAQQNDWADEIRQIEKEESAKYHAKQKQEFERQASMSSST